MCTVLLRHRPGTPCPLLLAAVRDEFLGRPWDPPAAHWPQEAPGIIGGRDRIAGGTWLALDPGRRAVAAVLNGGPLPPAPRPSRGELPLAALTGRLPADLTRYDAFHLILATDTDLRVWSWDGTELLDREVPPGDHIVVNDGLDAASDPLVPHFFPLLRKADGRDDWVELLAGDGLAPTDPRALILRMRAPDGRDYGSSSAALIALGERVRYDFAVDPGPSARWDRII
ncbi:hypothetical protein Val02_36530 [Virgisporangium aliadipatigenens]|uniref:NRDE family protein n=1 Tax=Virgisporangium aliadipatigenens TaxID=741659 RepID=A0A8J4DRY6_9ACTN|nr:NRDE family protein [Virgisporangium aliadipatigenens]GIJ46767.1 hypothetical protein Val02_36530 [Virgisporangium aliadipatigenens]